VDLFEAWFGDLLDETVRAVPVTARGSIRHDRAAARRLYLRVSTARQAEHHGSIPDQRRQGEGYCT